MASISYIPRSTPTIIEYKPNHFINIETIIHIYYDNGIYHYRLLDGVMLEITPEEHEFIIR